MKFKTLFIINPISGGKAKQGLPAQILRSLDLQKFEPSFQFTEREGHAAELAKQAVEQGFKLIVGVGGDGTLNEVASALVHSEVPMGIIPYGSGNGLARDLQIPLHYKKAILCLNQFNLEKIDVLKMNAHYFFNMAGMGYDALISEAFKNSTKRGFWEYFKLSIQKFQQFVPQTYQLELDGKSLERKAFLISFANSSQYGNNIYISPDSSLRDGQMEVVIVEPLNWRELLYFGLLMAIRQTKRFSKWEAFSARAVKICQSPDAPVHIDGEPLRMSGDIEIQLLPLALQVLSGRKK